MKKTPKRKTGDLGEDIVVTLIERRGWKIIERNYWKPWGEIDVVVRQGRQLHFIEVKTRSMTSGRTNDYRGEEAVDKRKQARLARVIQTYLNENDIKDEWQIDIAVVELHKEDKQANIRWLEDVIFE